MSFRTLDVLGCDGYRAAASSERCHSTTGALESDALVHRHSFVFDGEARRKGSRGMETWELSPKHPLNNLQMRKRGLCPLIRGGATSSGSATIVTTACNRLDRARRMNALLIETAICAGAASVCTWLVGAWWHRRRTRLAGRAHRASARGARPRARIAIVPARAELPACGSMHRRLRPPIAVAGDARAPRIDAVSGRRCVPASARSAIAGLLAVDGAALPRHRRDDPSHRRLARSELSSRALAPAGMRIARSR